MAIADQSTAVDTDKLMQFVFRAVDKVGATLNAALVVMGDKLGLSRALATLLCTPASLSQEVGLALGAQAGEARIWDVVAACGFTRFRRIAETPFNLAFEARP